MANIFKKFRWQCVSSDLKIQANGDKYRHYTVSASMWEAAEGIKEVTNGPRNKRASLKSTGGHSRDSSWNWGGTCPSKGWLNARKLRGKAWRGGRTAQECPIEFSISTEMFSIHYYWYLHAAHEHLKCGWCMWGTTFLKEYLKGKGKVLLPLYHPNILSYLGDNP